MLESMKIFLKTTDLNLFYQGQYGNLQSIMLPHWSPLYSLMVKGFYSRAAILSLKKNITIIMDLLNILAGCRADSVCDERTYES